MYIFPRLDADFPPTLRESTPPPPSLQGRFCFLFLILNKKTNKQIPKPLAGSDRLAAAGSQEVCLEEKGWGRVCPGSETPRNLWSGQAVGAGNLLGARTGAPFPPRLRPATGNLRFLPLLPLGCCHVGGRAPDLRSLHSAGNLQTPGRCSRMGARLTCAHCGFPAKPDVSCARRPGLLAPRLRAAPAPTRGGRAPPPPGPLPLRAARGGRRPQGSRGAAKRQERSRGPARSGGGRGRGVL